MTKYRLLAIEDNKDIADMVCRAAAEAGFEVRSADGTNAISIYDSFLPHVIMLDILMPQMDGLEFLQFLQTQESQAHIIILSGSSESYRKIAENLGTASGLNIEGNLSKPFRIVEMRTILERIKKSLDATSKLNEKMRNG